jgi:hypothetical protein
MSTRKSKEKEYTAAITLWDRLDVKILTEKGRLQGFVLSYRAKISGKWYEVYRVDTCHGYLHAQKFWQSPDPIPLNEYRDYPLEMVYEEFLDRILENWARYRGYLESEVKERKR